MPPATRVLVDGRALTDSSSLRGIGTYLRHVLAGLAGDPRLDVTVLCDARADLPPGARRLTTRRVAPGRWRNREHDLLLPLDLMRRATDVVWSPAMDAPRWVRGPWVQTLHDVWPALAPQHAADPAAWQRFAARLRSARAVVTVSRWTADSAVQALELDPRRVHVIPHGVSSVFQPGEGERDRPYLLYVGEYDPRKRHDHAFEAIGALAERGFPHVLRVTGRIAPWFEADLARLVAQSPQPARIELLGHVSLERLVALYQGASALLVTSRGEGFGLPALEAMACATPVVAYDNSATSEVVGGAGVLVPDGDGAALVEAVARVLAEPGLAEDIGERERERAAGFTWERSAADHAAVLRGAAP